MVSTCTASLSCKIDGLRRTLVICGVLTTVCGIDTPAHGQWVAHDQQGIVEIFSEFPTDTESLTTELMSVSQELQRSLDLPAPRHTVQVVLFASGDRYRAFLANRIPEARHRKAIFYSHRDVFQIYAYRNPQLLTDLRHEFTHAVLHQALPYLPLWIDEGLAEYFEDDPVSRSRSSRVAGVKWKSRMGWTPNLQQLEQLPAADQMDANDYRDSWAWISYLMNSSEASRELLKSYLLAISAGGVPGSFTDFATTRDPSILKGVGSYFRRFQISVR